VTKQEQVASFISNSILVRDRLGRFDFPASGLPDANGYADQRSVEDFALRLLTMSEFRALQLGAFLRTPDGQIISQAAEMVLPPGYRQQIEFLVAGLQLAARLQQREGEKTAGLVAVSVLVIGMVILVFRRD
jgi:hypothetical protein